MEFFAYYLYKGYSLYAESEEGFFHYDRADKRWYPVDPGWEMDRDDDIKPITPERAARFL